MMSSRRKGDGQDEGLLALLRYAGRRRWLVIVGCVLAGISALAALVPYLCIGRIAFELFSGAADEGAPEHIAAWGAVAAAAAAFSIVTYMAGLGCAHRAAFRIATNIRIACCEHLLKVPLGFYQRVSSGKLRRHIDTGADMTEDVIAHKLPDAVVTVLTPIAFVVLSFALDWRMGLACLVPMVVSFFMLGMSMGNDAASAMDDYQDALDAMNQEAVEYVRGMPVVKVFQQSVYSFRKFYRVIVAYGNLAFGFAQASERPQVSFSVVSASAFALLIPVIAFAAEGVAAQEWGRFAANALFYAALCGSVPGMLARVMYVGQSTMSARVALRNINAVLSVEPLDQPDAPEKMRDASVEFDDVSFSYGDDAHGAQDALSHVSFRVEPGCTLALVGPSGGGKSTCASLIPRFWDVGAGAVRVGGVDVRRLDQRELMENVAFVSQNGKLFKDTILENVRAARPEASREQVLDALSDAQCDDIIAKLPEGIDTPIGEQGVHLSGGECQRLLLARALLKDPPILVLDEATAFADADNEARIQGVLSYMGKERTMVLIAHRLSTVVRADLILVMDEDRIVERGTHETLLEAGGLYSQMWEDYQRSIQWEIARSRGAQSGAAAHRAQERNER